MPWAWIGLWRYWICLAFPLVVPFLIFAVDPEPGIGFVIVYLVAFFSTMTYWKRHHWLWPLARACRRFAVVSRPGITVYYDPRAATDLDAGLLLQICRHERDALALRFGFPLRGRIRVYFFPEFQQVSRIFGTGFGGFALNTAKAIIVCDYGHNQELIRHELAHLFAFRWSRMSPLLVSEGFAVYSQRTWGGKPIDDTVRELLSPPHEFLSPLRSLTGLLTWEDFHRPEHQYENYKLAGSFTGYLIRRFGWDQYRRFYRRVTVRNFCRRFRATFGQDFAEAERAWRDELR